MKSSEIRQAFMQYFKDKGHTVVPSSSLIPGNDATLLFTNAGMVQFKETFLGLEKRPYTQAVSAQRCLRAGGKHNDLENVGYTARHHTFFEMLGNFSFGDYFKREAIFYAWEFLTQVLKLPPEKLWVTVYTDDDEAAAIWLDEVGVSPARFSRLGDADNFWSMGETGPCGPCTEIFYDHGSDVFGGPPGSPDADGDRYIEVWNLVFMQYNRDKNGELHPLPKPSVDTGMGLERIAAVVQGVHTNYDIDSFQHIIKAIVALNPAMDKDAPSIKVIADHIRACAALIAEGITPSNEGRGYVLRRIIRRAIRHGNKLGLPMPFFGRLVTPLTEVMAGAYPELLQLKGQIEQVLEQEELRFAQTLEQGLRHLYAEIKGLKDKVIVGEIAFKLYDTYGFPLDLTEDIARELGLTVDVLGFEESMQHQRVQSQMAGQFAVDYSETLYLDQKSDFLGYETTQVQAKIKLLVCGDKKQEKLETKDSAFIVLDKTPFYAESGGQAGDRGFLKTKNALFAVQDTQKMGDAIIHHGNLVHGSLQVDDIVEAEVDASWRAAVRLNHTATHLLHAALRVVLGPHIQQKGSLVRAEKARFDFSHKEALTKVELKAVEDLVNQHIRLNQVVQTDIMSLDDAKQSGAVALFGEKYQDAVRVLSVGDFSKELCGGTHAHATGDIGLFKIVTEYGVASGVRRLEFLTGGEALNYVHQQLTWLNEAAGLLKTDAAQLIEKLTQIVKDAKELEKANTALQAKQALATGADLLKEVEVVQGINLLVHELKNQDSAMLRTMLDKLKSSLNDAVIVLYIIDGEKLQVIAGLSKSLVGKVPSAVDFVTCLCGKGGGRPDMAQGGSVFPQDFKERLAQVKALLVGRS